MTGIDSFVFGAAMAVSVALGCAGGGEASTKGGDAAGGETAAAHPDEPIATVTKQDSIDEKTFDAEAKSDAGLKAVADKLKADGYASFVAAGTAADDSGAEVIWARYSNAQTGAVRDAVRHCAKKECAFAVQSFESDKAVWKDSSAKALEVRRLGQPGLLLKNLDGHNPDGQTHVVASGLEYDDFEVPPIDIEKRRFIIASAFGNTYDLDLSGLADAVSDVSFDVASEDSFVTRASIHDYLTAMHPYDVLVWVGHTVREEANSAQKIFKAVGLTTGVGGFGDETYHVEDIAADLKGAALSGPGLIFLAGSESLGDKHGSDDYDESLKKTFDNDSRVIVGIEGRAEARYIAGAAARFFSKLGSGATLLEALDDANAYLEDKGATGRLKTNAAADMGWTLMADTDTYWGAKTPEPGQFNSYVYVVAKCKDASGNSLPQPPEGQEAIVVDVNELKKTKGLGFSGPFFTGHGIQLGNEKNWEVDVRGVLLGREKGDHFFFVAQGDLSPDMQQVTIFGNAVIQEATEQGGSVELNFNGSAVASPFKDKEGNTCVMNNPTLSSSTSELGWLRVQLK